MESFKKFYQENKDISAEDYHKLYDTLNRWSRDLASVNTQEMSFLKKFQPFFHYKGPLYRVIWLTPHKKYTLQQLKQLDAKQEVLSYKSAKHVESSWSRSSDRVKMFAQDFLEDDATSNFTEFEDQNIQQIITVLCKQLGEGFHVAKFYAEYVKRFGDMSQDPIAKSAEIEEVIAPYNNTMQANIAFKVFGAPGIINRPKEGESVVSDEKYTYPEPPVNTWPVYDHPTKGVVEPRWNGKTGAWVWPAWFVKWCKQEGIAIPSSR
jgi:hypothetical protein